MPFTLMRAEVLFHLVANTVFVDHIGDTAEFFFINLLVTNLTTSSTRFIRGSLLSGLPTARLPYQSSKDISLHHLCFRSLFRVNVYLFIFFVSTNSLSAVLVRLEDGGQYSVSYVSRSLVNAKKGYPQFEKLALALIMPSRKLKPYFQALNITVVTGFLFKQVLLKPDICDGCREENV